MLGTATIQTGAPPRRDVYLRRSLFDEASFTHHGKANLYLLEQLISGLVDPGELVLDPMGGTGSAYIGLMVGRSVLAGDIEPQWAKLLGRNLELARRDLIAFGVPGLAAQWDAGSLPLPSGVIGFCVTSPPYFDTFGDWDKSSNILADGYNNEHGISYGVHPRQIANQHVYENYLCAMARVYSELWRVLHHQGKLALILKDVIRGGRMVPVVEDNAVLAVARGFNLLERYDIPVRGTRFRNVQKVRLGQAAPSTETVLVLEKIEDPRTKRRLALVELPLAHDRPGWVMASKVVWLSRDRGYRVWVRSPGRLLFDLDVAAVMPMEEQTVRPRIKARLRKDKAFSMVRDLVTKAGLGAGDEIAFYGSDVRYGRYICRRLETLGCSVTSPLLGKNNGQRAAWLTEALGQPRHFDVGIAPTTN